LIEIEKTMKTKKMLAGIDVPVPFPGKVKVRAPVVKFEKPGWNHEM